VPDPIGRVDGGAHAVAGRDGGNGGRTEVGVGGRVVGVPDHVAQVGQHAGGLVLISADQHQVVGGQHQLHDGLGSHLRAGARLRDHRSGTAVEHAQVVIDAVGRGFRVGRGDRLRRGQGASGQSGQHRSNGAALEAGHDRCSELRSRGTRRRRGGSRNQGCASRGRCRREGSRCAGDGKHHARNDADGNESLAQKVPFDRPATRI
jgi:hypothetical protein